MAKVKYNVYAQDDQFIMLTMLANGGEFQMGRHNARKMTIYDQAEENYVVIQGHGLKYKNDMPTAGRIEEITFFTEAGKAAVSISGNDVDVNVKALSLGLLRTVVSSAMSQATKGADKATGSSEGDYIEAGNGKNIIKGLAGDDFLFAGFGNDQYTGGTGNDRFIYGGGRDTITDFDALGGIGQQDHIQIASEYSDFTAVTRGKDVIIDFHDGNTIRLVKASIANIDSGDFIIAG